MKPTIRIALDVLLKDRHLTRYALAQKVGTNYQIIDNYYKNRVVRYDSDLLLRICLALDCGIEDIIKITK